MDTSVRGTTQSLWVVFFSRDCHGKPIRQLLRKNMADRHVDFGRLAASAFPLRVLASRQLQSIAAPIPRPASRAYPDL